MFLNEWVGGERQEAFQLGEGKLRNEESRWLICLPALTDWAGGAGVREGGGGRGTWRAGTPLRLQGAYELLVLLLGSVGPLGVGSNLLVLVLYLKFTRLRSPARLLLLNVTFAFRLRGGVVGGATNCVWDGFSNNLSGIVSIITLTTLACERYIGMIHNRVISFSLAWRAITYTWLYSLVRSGAPLLGRNRYVLAVHVLGCTANWKSKDASDDSFVFFLFLGCMVVPVGVIAHCYGHILYSIRKVS
uniref:G-protein coupled receptors family 1 profile domain-containing protein n=1 Tax=Balaenoptera musculus TaxID=9771 RepID=A0A8C0CC92_BALMU